MKKSAPILAFSATLALLTAGVSTSPAACDAVCRVLSDPLRRGLSGLSSLVPFPLCELALIALPAVLPFVLYRAARDPAFPRRATTAVALFFSLFLAFSVLPARRVPPADPTPPTDAEWIGFAAFLAENANRTEAALPPARGPGTPPALDDVGELSTAVVARLLAEYPTPTKPTRVKRTLFPRLLTRWGLLGYHAAWTGEAVIVPTAPPYTIAFTAAHEAAHQAGVLTEGEASFAAYLSLVSSPEPALAYSGYAGALDAVLPLLPSDARLALLSSLSPRVREDLLLFDAFLPSGGRAAAFESGNAASVRLRGGEERGSYDLFPLLACRAFLGSSDGDQADPPAIY